MTRLDDINRLAAASATAHATLPTDLALAIAGVLACYPRNGSPLAWEEPVMGLADAVLAVKVVGV